jgi:hypothetical protein
MVYSQIWLNHLPNNWQFGYKTILKERKTIPPTSMILCKIINRFKIPKRRVMEDEGIFNFDVKFCCLQFPCQSKLLASLYGLTDIHI